MSGPRAPTGYDTSLKAPRSSSKSPETGLEGGRQCRSSGERSPDRGRQQGRAVVTHTDPAGEDCRIVQGHRGSDGSDRK